MESQKEKKLVILGLIVIASFLYIMWVAISADPIISAAIIGTMATVLVSVAATIFNQRQIKLREIAEAHREKKVEIYQKFITTISSLIVGQNNQVTMNAPTEQELINCMVNFRADILLYGSPKVIKAQLEFEKISAPKYNVLVAANNLYKAIREDIGLSNAGLNNSELVKLYLKDPSELDK